MNPSTIFTIANTLALLSWVILTFAPKWSLTQRLVHTGNVSLALAAIYWLALGAFMLSPLPAGWGFGSLSAVRALFSSDWGLLAGWVHYLAFDLLLGVEVDRRFNRRLPQLRLLCLLGTFLFGPVGWSLSRLIIRSEPDA